MLNVVPYCVVKLRVNNVRSMLRDINRYRLLVHCLFLVFFWRLLRVNSLFPVINLVTYRGLAVRLRDLRSTITFNTCQHLLFQCPFYVFLADYHVNPTIFGNKFGCSFLTSGKS